MTTAPVPALGAVARGPVDLLRVRRGVFRDYAQLTKIRVTTLVVVTAWSGYFFGEHKTGVPVLTLKLLWALAGALDPWPEGTHWREIARGESRLSLLLAVEDLEP